VPRQIIIYPTIIVNVSDILNLVYWLYKSEKIDISLPLFLRERRVNFCSSLETVYRVKFNATQLQKRGKEIAFFNVTFSDFSACFEDLG